MSSNVSDSHAGQSCLSVEGDSTGTGVLYEGRMAAGAGVARRNTKDNSGTDVKRDSGETLGAAQLGSVTGGLAEVFLPRAAATWMLGPATGGLRCTDVVGGVEAPEGTESTRTAVGHMLFWLVPVHCADWAHTSGAGSEDSNENELQQRQK